MQPSRGEQVCGGESGRGPRVIAGEAGGLRLTAPKGTRTRPTADRVKEALFAALGPGRLLGGWSSTATRARALAIEALSRARRAPCWSTGTRSRSTRSAATSARPAERPGPGPAPRRRCRGRWRAAVRTLPSTWSSAIRRTTSRREARRGPGRPRRAGLGRAGRARWWSERAASAGPPLLPPGWGVTWSTGLRRYARRARRPRDRALIATRSSPAWPPHSARARSIR